jgi:hypothetical protein
MDDYHEFRHAHEIQIEEWRLYCFPNDVSITRGIVALSGATTILGISSTSGSGSATNNGATKSGGITKGGGAGASISTRAHCPYLSQLWNYFVNCDKITKRLGLISCGVCKISNVSPMRVCEKPMYVCVGSSW